MPLMMWTDKYSVNIKDVDTQHMKLVELLNGFHESMKLGKSKEVMGGLLRELADYTVYHFGSEEKLLKTHGYPAFIPHKKEHDALTKQVQDLGQRFSRGEPVMGVETMNFLKNWLNDHMLGTDKKYATFLNLKGVL